MTAEPHGRHWRARTRATSRQDPREAGIADGGGGGAHGPPAAARRPPSERTAKPRSAASAPPRGGGGPGATLPRWAGLGPCARRDFDARRRRGKAKRGSWATCAPWHALGSVDARGGPRCARRAWRARHGRLFQRCDFPDRGCRVTRAKASGFRTEARHAVTQSRRWVGVSFSRGKGGLEGEAVGRPRSAFPAPFRGHHV